jgi:DNA-binding MarR family transcriptional regulator
MLPNASSDELILERFLPYRLSYTANLVSDAIANVYQRSFGLAIPEWRVIAHVAESAGITQQQIGLRTRMDKVTVSRATRALSSRGLIARKPNPLDQRSRLLVLTARGRQLYRAVAPRALELERAVFDQFSAREIAGLRRTLARIDAAAARLTLPE